MLSTGVYPLKRTEVTVHCLKDSVSIIGWKLAEMMDMVGIGLEVFF